MSHLSAQFQRITHIYMCSILYYGNINKDTITLSYSSFIVILWSTVTVYPNLYISSRFGHASYIWSLYHPDPLGPTNSNGNPIPAREYIYIYICPLPSLQSSCSVELEPTVYIYIYIYMAHWRGGVSLVLHLEVCPYSICWRKPVEDSLYLNIVPWRGGE